jgi:hypothetical protein
VSAGVASTSQTLPDDLIRLADRLMYENKREYYRNLGRPDIADRVIDYKDDRQPADTDRTME